jgi:hypothetical protein
MLEISVVPSGVVTRVAGPKLQAMSALLAGPEDAAPELRASWLVCHTLSSCNDPRSQAALDAEVRNGTRREQRVHD